MDQGMFVVSELPDLTPTVPPPELVAATGQSLELYLRGELSMDDPPGLLAPESPQAESTRAAAADSEFEVTSTQLSS